MQSRAPSYRFKSINLLIFLICGVPNHVWLKGLCSNLNLIDSSQDALAAVVCVFMGVVWFASLRMWVSFVPFVLVRVYLADADVDLSFSFA